jgi:hypothetical protein
MGENLEESDDCLNVCGNDNWSFLFGITFCVRHVSPDSFIAPLFIFCSVYVEMLCNETLDHFLRIKMFLCSDT